MQTAIAISENVSKPTVLVGEDTDLLVLLCFHTKSTSRNIYFRPEPKHGANHPPKCWIIALLKIEIRLEVCHSVLFMHAILGCDTTSSIYGIGKKAALKLAYTSAPFIGYAQVFNDPEASKTYLISAGEDALVTLYKGRPGYKLDLLRLHKFYQKVIVSTSVTPTSASATYHSI